MEELELTYLVKTFPDKYLSSESNELLDIYIPSTSEHPNLRIRKRGDKLEITKKQPLKEGDASHQLETTIPLTEEEYAELATLPGKRIWKTRYLFTENSVTYEIDVFRGTLTGLAMADVEFRSLEAKASFIPPAWCLADVTHETFLAGGMLCGKTYFDIEPDLERFGYKKLLV